MGCSAPLFAAMPLNTDDTGTQGKGRCQVELATEFSHDKSDADGISVKEDGRSLSATFSYGLSDTVDLVAGVPFEWSRVRENGVSVADEQGAGDVSLQVKWRILEAASGFSVALKPGITLPTGDDAKGQGSGRVCGEMTLIATQVFGPGAMHVNLGYTHNDYRLDDARASSRENILRASVAGELAMAERLRAVADIGVQTNEDKSDGTAPAYLLGGLIYGVSDNLDLDLGVRGALNDADADTTLMAGVTMRF